MMHASDLRHVVVFQRPIESRDAAGGMVVEAWSPYARAYARVEESTGTEATEARQLTASREVRLTIRYRRDVRAAHRAVLGPRVLEISRPPIDRTGTREWLTLHCVERDA